MKASSYLLLVSVMVKELKRKSVWKQAIYRQKIKKMYLCYLLALNKEKANMDSQVAVRNIWTRPIFTEEKRKIHGCGNTLFVELEKEATLFFNYFRMPTVMFFELLNVLEERIRKQDVVRRPIEPKIRLALTLRYLASGDSMVSIAYAFRVAPQTVSNIIAETCEALWECLSITVLKTPTEEDWKTMALDFEAKWDFPHCIGAIDGKHVVIQAPPNSGSSHYNYKNSHSIILMAVVDANMCFTFVDIGAPGRNSDSGVFRQCSIGMGLENNLLGIPKQCPLNKDPNITFPYVIVGDEAFALTTYMMRPYPRSGNLNRRKKVFNYRLSRARRIVECAFGVLRGRWRIFAKPIIASEATTRKIVQATICLHNFIMRRESSLPVRDLKYSQLDISTAEPSAGLTDIGQTGSNAYTRNAAMLRDRLAEYFENKGAVPWQWQKIENNDF